MSRGVRTRKRIADWSKPENLILIEGWARDGLTVDEIAKKIGIGRTTLYSWMSKNPNIEDAIKIGREVADYVVERALYKKAASGTDTLAMMYWLNNRKPEKWRQKRNEQLATTEQETEMLAEIGSLAKQMTTAENVVETTNNDLEELVNE